MISLLLAVVTPTYAAHPRPATAADGSPSPHRPANGAIVHVLANSDDAFLGLHYRRDLATGVGVFGIAGGRFWDKTVFDQLRPHFYLQRAETRYFFGSGAEAWLPISTRFRLSAGAGAVYTLGDFAGSEEAPEEGWTPLFLGGASVAFPTGGLDFVLRATYMYADLRSPARNWIEVGGGVAW